MAGSEPVIRRSTPDHRSTSTASTGPCGRAFGVLRVARREPVEPREDRLLVLRCEHPGDAVGPHPPQCGPVRIVVVVRPAARRAGSPPTSASRRSRSCASAWRPRRCRSSRPARRRPWARDAAGPPRPRWRAGRRAPRRSARVPPRASFAVQLGDGGLEALHRRFHRARPGGGHPVDAAPHAGGLVALEHLGVGGCADDVTVMSRPASSARAAAPGCARAPPRGRGSGPSRRRRRARDPARSARCRRRAPAGAAAARASASTRCARRRRARRRSSPRPASRSPSSPRRARGARPCAAAHPCRGWPSPPGSSPRRPRSRSARPTGSRGWRPPWR